MAIPEYQGERISAEMVVRAAKRTGWKANPQVYVYSHAKEACELGLVYVDRFGVPQEEEDEDGSSYDSKIVDRLGITFDYPVGYNEGFSGWGGEQQMHLEGASAQQLWYEAGYRDGYAAYLACEEAGLFA